MKMATFGVAEMLFLVGSFYVFSEVIAAGQHYPV